MERSKGAQKVFVASQSRAVREARRAAKPSFFTEHILGLDEQSFPPPEVLAQLLKILRGKMRQRMLLHSSPAYLGVRTSSRWSEGGALDDLLFDCYEDVILRRLQSLRQQAKICDNLDGFVRQNIDHFLTERQRRADPVGYAVFQNTKAALIVAVGAGELELEGRAEASLSATSKLRFVLPPSDQGPQPSLVDALGTLPDWPAGAAELARCQNSAQDFVRSCLRGMSAAGIAGFTVRDLVDVLKVPARASWLARMTAWEGTTGFETDAGGDAHAVPVLPPDGTYEQWESFFRGVERAQEAVDALQRPRALKERLSCLLALLVSRAIDEGSDVLPTQAELTRFLGVPRATMSDDIKVLRGVVEAAFQELSSRPLGSSADDSSLGPVKDLHVARGKRTGHG